MQVGLEALGPEGKAVELTCSIGKLKGARGHVGLGAGSCPLSPQGLWSLWLPGLCWPSSPELGPPHTLGCRGCKQSSVHLLPVPGGRGRGVRALPWLAVSGRVDPTGL